MSQTDIVAKFYRKNNRTAFGRGISQHSMTVKLGDYPVDEPNISLSGDDFPYFRLALIDRHLEELLDVTE